MPSPLRILVVEDDLATLGYFVELLLGWGYQVEGARSAVEAIDSVKRNCPNLVVSDLVMPGMSGLQLLKALRTIETCRIFFILITGYGSVSTAVEAITQGADDILLKPVDTERFQSMLQRFEMA